MDDYLGQWELYLRALYAKTTRIAYLYDVTRFQAFVGKSLLEVSTQDIQLFVTQEGQRLMASTICRLVSALRAFYTWCVQRELLEVSPVNGIKTPRGGKRLPRVLRKDEIEALVKHEGASRRERAIVLLMLDAGLRLVEVSRLLRTDVNLQDRTVLVRGKGDKQRMIPLSERLYDALAEWFYHNQGMPYDPLFPGYKGEPLKPRAIGYIISRVGQTVKLERNLSPHLLRHTFATRLLRQGVNLRVIQQLLGHANISTTQIYTEVVSADLVQAIDQLMK